MLTSAGHPDCAPSHAIRFTKEILDASAAAFYEVDDDLALSGFLICGIPGPIPIEFHHRYIGGMDRFDPLHPRHAKNRLVARLADEMTSGVTTETVTYRSFLSHFRISDMVELFFRRGDKVVAGLSVTWGGNSRVPDGAMQMVQKIHEYLQFNLTRSVGSAVSEVPRYGLTAREVEVVSLLCCGRTNREISECLKIGPATVKTHLIHIFEKLGVETRSAAVAMMSRPFRGSMA